MIQQARALTYHELMSQQLKFPNPYGLLHQQHQFLRIKTEPANIN